MEQRKGREEHPKRNRQTIVLLLILSLFLTVVLSGCLGSEKQTNNNDEVATDEDFWLYIRGFGEFQNSAGETWKASVVALDESDIEKALNLTLEARDWHEKSKKSALLAVERADTEEKKKWAECLAEAANYGILGMEKNADSLEYWVEGKKEKAVNTAMEGKEISSKALDQALKCKDLEP